MKKIIVFLLVTLLLSGCGKMPDKHKLDYPEDLETLYDGAGADEYEGYMDHSDSRYYITNDYYNLKSDNDLHIISNFKTYQQTTDYSCGNACAYMVLSYYGITEYNENDLVKLFNTDTSKGTSMEGFGSGIESIGLDYELNNQVEYKFETDYLAEEFFISHIDNKEPVIVNCCDWGGHYMVVIGIDTCGTEDIDDDVIIFADPYDVTDHYQDGYYVYPFSRFFTMWYEGPCALKDVPYVQPYIIIKR